MQFEDREVGKYRIHAGSLELRAGQGHLASVIVNRSRDGKTATREVYRDLAVSGGHRWLTSDQALQRALMLGAIAVTAERHRALSQSGRSTSDAAGVIPLLERHQADLNRPWLMRGPAHV